MGHTHRAALSDLLQVPADDPSRLSGPDRSPPLPPLRRGSPAIVEPLAGCSKKAHLRRWHAEALAAAYWQYASLGPARAALHLDLF
jgi:hypothetical protein